MSNCNDEGFMTLSEFTNWIYKKKRYTFNEHLIILFIKSKHTCFRM